MRMVKFVDMAYVIQCDLKASMGRIHFRLQRYVKEAGAISHYVDSSNMHTFYQHHQSEHRWTKDHPLEQLLPDRCEIAFLNGPLMEDVYVAQPEGFVVPDSSRKVLPSKKSFYIDLIDKLREGGLDSSFELTAFSDADYVKCIDTRKRTYEGIQFLGYKYKRRCCSLTPAESDSLSHAHTQATETYYKHQDSRIKKAQELNTKTSTNSDTQDLPKDIKIIKTKIVKDKDKQGKDLKISDLKTKSKDNDKGSRSKIIKHEGTCLKQDKDQDQDSKTQRQSNLHKSKEARFKELASGEIVYLKILS
ncbi:hypothetical protein Tco_1111372 [Tanacetum coccineum]|uniref:Uncharacterized protein n=1 Tax=Tanacetum coccineum TaxID=301880 RepID=A0ABQ5IP44_9ASTR